MGRLHVNCEVRKYTRALMKNRTAHLRKTPPVTAGVVCRVALRMFNNADRFETAQAAVQTVRIFNPYYAIETHGSDCFPRQHHQSKQYHHNWTTVTTTPHVLTHAGACAPRGCTCRFNCWLCRTDKKKSLVLPVSQPTSEHRTTRLPRKLTISYEQQIDPVVQYAHPNSVGRVFDC